MRKIVLILCLFVAVIELAAQEKAIYKIYDKAGKSVSYDEMIKNSASADVVFFGESHNCPVMHWLELQVAKELYAAHKDKFVIGAEMFERDNQLILDEYIQGLISRERFENEMRLWKNYATDYRPLVRLAKKNHLKFVATNIPRRYARIVKKEGLEGLNQLSKEAKRYIAPLPIYFQVDSSQIKLFKMMGGMRSNSKMDPLKMSQAQTIKDATMAWFISENVKDKKMLHLNGSFHSNKHKGIVPYLKRYNKKLNVLTISGVRQRNIRALAARNKGIADYIIVIREDMNRSY